MIVVVGSPVAQPAGAGIEAGGLAATVARAAAASGAAVQIVGRVGEDPAGDLVLLALAASGIGHVAVLREPGRLTPTAPAPGAGGASPDGPDLAEAMLDDESGTDEPAIAGDETASSGVSDGLSVDAADLELALRYVQDYRVLVVAADLDPGALAAVIEAAGWSGAHLVVLQPDGSPPAVTPDAATVLLRPADDPDGVFASMVAGYAVGLDRGQEPAAAFASAQSAGGWAAVAD
ncbi:MAG TPA: PfkB family carbohydrate kinase [Verrucomicrobiae bacterium]|nr:PfkB family carbohydrate kinase [Verrucomicrobiae bacterium]